MLLATVCALHVMASPMTAKDAGALKADIDFVVKTVEQTHPAPFEFLSKSEFERQADGLKKHLSRQSKGCAVAELMALVAEMHDGHSYIDPVNTEGLQRWFPIRFYAFSDGVFVTAAAPEHKALVAKRVLSLNGVPIEAAMKKVALVQAANNPLAAAEGATWLSDAAIATAIGTASGDSMTVNVDGGDGRQVSETITSFTDKVSDAWMQHGEMFGPRRKGDSQPYVTAFGDRAPLDYRKNDAGLPPHLRYRLPYFMVEMPKDRILYFQWNFVQDWGDENFVAFQKRLFARLDEHPDWKFIIDVRYNSGGDGSKVPPFIRQIIKRDRFDVPGKLFVLTGRKTFSAAIDFVGMAKDWTSAIFVGEPTGAGLIAYGDPQDFDTPNARIHFQISTSRHQHGDPHLRSGAFDPDIPAPMSSATYFSGSDPALDIIARDQDDLPITVVLEQQGASVAREALARRQTQWGGIAWYVPFTEHDMNEAAYRCLRSGKVADAVAGFELNAQFFPNSWNAWDSLAEAERTAHDISKAIADYQKSLALNPGNENGKSAIADMKAAGK